MNQCFEDISVSGDGWVPANKSRETLTAYQYRLEPQSSTYLVGPFIAYSMQTGQPTLLPGQRFAEADVERWLVPNCWTMNWMSEPLTIAMMVVVEPVEVPEPRLPNYLKEVIKSLPPMKLARLLSALRRIDGYIRDIEARDDGEIVIETEEGGSNCFYAICTQEGDFKGTWISEGVLRTEPWSANPPYVFPALSLR